VNSVAAPPRLLVVDDEPTILELLSGSLRLAGFEVMTAASGGEAMRAAASGRPDLAIAASLAAAHGGEITVDTAPSRGAAFHLRLPQAKISEETPTGSQGQVR
jgi:DNA-binding NtrC family response regulator